MFASLGGEGAFGEAVAHQQGPAAWLSDGDHDTDGAGGHQLNEGGMGNGFHGGDLEAREDAAQNEK